MASLALFGLFKGCWLAFFQGGNLLLAYLPCGDEEAYKSRRERIDILAKAHDECKLTGLIPPVMKRSVL